MTAKFSVRLLAHLLMLAALAVTVTRAGVAQTSTGTIRGTVTDEAGATIAGATINATNTSSGVLRAATTNEQGFYALPGLTPGTYDIRVRHIGHAPQGRRIQVLIGQSLTLDLALVASAVEVQDIAVVTTALPETRTSEIATNVSQEQIERLPTVSRNFLDLAALAPGINVAEDRLNSFSPRTFSSGGQSPNAANVFIDGTSLKNDLTGGGVAGQDNSRGNPFPRNSIQEYRVITQNFKAEYQKSSSSLITATTRSGGNTWEGNAFFTFQGKSTVALDTFQIARQAANPTAFAEPEYTRYLGGLSVGGPIIRDRLHFFGAYEGNYQNRDNPVAFAPPSGFPALDTVNLAQYNGNFTSPFRETLLFGKLSYAVSPISSAEFSFSNRHETDVRDFGPAGDIGFNSFQQAINYRQNVSIAQGRYNIFSGPWLNEVKLDYSRFRRNPAPNESGLPQRLFEIPGGDYVIGSNRSTQDFIQRRIGIRDDLTYTGFEAAGQHVFKIGASVDLVNYDIVKDNNGTPQFRYSAAYGYEHPYRLSYSTGDAAFDESNTQIGLYIQDDWSPSQRLTINAGIRWDYESNMLNADYVTPQNVIDTLTRYNDELIQPLDLDRYISTGDSREAFKGAFQPRVGFSYALDSENRTTIFGGFGIYYDRSLFDVSIDETQQLTHPNYNIEFAAPGVAPGPGQVAWDDSYLTADRAVLDQLVGTFGRPEAWLIANDVKVPKSRQWNIGIRQVVGDFLVSASYAGQRGVDQLTLNWANFGLNDEGGCCTSFDLGAHGFSNFIYSTNDAKTWYDALLLQLERPYQGREDGIGWGAGIAFTYAVRSLEGVDAVGDLFAFPNTAGIPKHPANDERARVVANWITDIPYLFGIQFSGLITLGSGPKQDIGGPLRFNNPDLYVRGGFSPPGENFLIFGKWVYRRVDVRLRKDFPNLGRTNIGVTLDAFNVFNYANLGGFNTPGNQADINFGKATRIEGDPRRVQLGVELDF